MCDSSVTTCHLGPPYMRPTFEMDSQQAVPARAADRTVHLTGLLIHRFNPCPLTVLDGDQVTLRQDAEKEELMLEETQAPCGQLL